MERNSDSILRINKPLNQYITDNNSFSFSSMMVNLKSLPFSDILIKDEDKTSS